MAGIKDRATNQVTAKVVDSVDAETLQVFVLDSTRKESVVYTDGASAYVGIPRAHESVRHSSGEYVRGEAHTNGIESFGAGVKRSIMGTYHKVSNKHLPRYMMEMEGHHNLRPLDTADQMAAMARGMNREVGYWNLVAGYA